MFLRNVIIDKNKKEILPLNFKDFENVKTEYAHLRVDLLNKIKENFIQPEVEEKNSSLNYDEYIKNSFIKFILNVLIIFPVYQVILIFVGTLFGQFNYFWSFQKKFLNKLFKKKVE